MPVVQKAIEVLPAMKLYVGTRLRKKRQPNSEGE